MSLEQVREFHIVFGHPISKYPNLPSPDIFNLRKTLILEELEETVRDARQGDLVKYVDGLADMTVVINGSILVFGRDVLIEDMGSYQEERFYSERNDIPKLPSDVDLELFEGDISLLIHRLSHYYERSDLKKCIEILYELRYEVYSLCLWTGIPIQEINEVVHKANMSKLGADGKPIYRESDNKILKGPNFRPPEEDIKRILREHGADL